MKLNDSTCSIHTEAKLVLQEVIACKYSVQSWLNLDLLDAMKALFML